MSPGQAWGLTAHRRDSSLLWAQQRPPGSKARGEQVRREEEADVSTETEALHPRAGTTVRASERQTGRGLHFFPASLQGPGSWGPSAAPSLAGREANHWQKQESRGHRAETGWLPRGGLGWRTAGVRLRFEDLLRTTPGEQSATVGAARVLQGFSAVSAAPAGPGPRGVCRGTEQASGCRNAADAQVVLGRWKRLR
ncbi:uncharacterized protein LOC116660639 isoform X2 [Camelus ferus]|uniref:Uncharacterized protein LOC116660639 isoform X2 n=1 Tax=Camelus ferus TaxID=419612 RepID=A0A8B8SAG5_CAMFR|nr:uncharacterized protein LOC116660639 isoform X2 [Camelus ferus]